MPQEVRPRVRRRASSEARRAQILEAALRCFSDKGYHETTMDDLAREAGLSKGSLYWYFPSKEEFFAEILRSAHHELRRRQQAAITDESDAVRRIELGIRATLAWFHDHRDYFTLLQFAATEERFAPIVSESQETTIADTVQHLKEAIVDGRISDQDPETAAQAIVGVTSQLARVHLFQRGEPVEQVADAAVSFCLHGISG